MRLLLSLLLVITSTQASETQDSSVCESIEANIFDASQDSAEDLSESQYCSENDDDANCINALKLNCSIN